MEDVEVDDIDKLEQLLAAEDTSDEENTPEQDVSQNKDPYKESSFLKDLVEADNNEIEFRKENFEVKRKPEESLSKSKYLLQQNENTFEKKKSFIHNGDTDSSDDEEKKNFMERKYSDYGLGIKKILQQKEETRYDSSLRNEKNTPSSSFKTQNRKTSSENLTTKPDKPSDVYFDPIFQIRLIRPLISGAQLKERMEGRDAVHMSKIKRHVALGDKSKDWVTAGVIVRKSATQESKKGAQYCIWTLSDLKDDLKTVSVFLFRNAYKQLWKTSQGAVVGILNPNILDNKDEKGNEACLSVDNPDRVMILGTSKDFAFCKSKKNNGDPCTSFVNVSQCEYCIYHIKQQYKKCSIGRSELQSKISGRGLVDLQNKLLGKNTLIYGGKSYSAIPAVKSSKLAKKDSTRMQSLSEYFQPSDRDVSANRGPVMPPVKKRSALNRVEVSVSQRLKDMKRLELLQVGTSKTQCVLKMEENMNKPVVQEQVSSGITSRDNKTNNSISKPLLKTNESSNIPVTKVPTLGIPMLGFGLKKSSMIDLSTPVTKKHTERAKLNALKWIQQNGPLKKQNPNNIKGTEEGKKRNLSKLNSSTEEADETENKQTPKKPKTGVHSETFQKMLEISSAHVDLINDHDDLEADKYFDKLEKKEKMEEKMLSTYKVPCKAVRCLKCSYTSFSASDRCKQEQHPLKVYDAVKRFFKCGNCSNRIASLDIFPTHSCKNCSSSSWQRAGMIAEKKALTTASKLSITGGEEFLGHVEHGADINLLVPEDFK